MDIPELLKSVVGSTLRHALTGIGAVLVAKGWVSEADFNSLLAGLIVIVAGYLWSLYLKWKAAQTPAGGGI